MMLVMWYLEIRVSRSDSEALSYDSLHSALLLDPTIQPDVSYTHGNGFWLQWDMACVLGWEGGKKDRGNRSYTYRTGAAIDATFSKTVVALYMIDCLGNVPKVQYVL